jgi:hypothetical protein
MSLRLHQQLPSRSSGSRRDYRARLAKMKGRCLATLPVRQKDLDNSSTGGHPHQGLFMGADGRSSVFCWFTFSCDGSGNKMIRRGRGSIRACDEAAVWA